MILYLAIVAQPSTKQFIYFQFLSQADRGGDNGRARQQRAQRSPTRPDTIAFSNGIRLTVWEWVGLAVFALIIVMFAPALWRRPRSSRSSRIIGYRTI